VELKVDEDRLCVAAIGWVAPAWGATAVFAQGADAAPGQSLFQRRCGACHQIETPRNGVGPHLQGVIGREAGGIVGFNYSPVLRDSGITWNAETLETYLSNPAAMVRGTRMTQRFNDADERRAIIEFLASERQHDLAKAKQLGTRSIMVGFTAISERLAPDALVDATRPGSCAVGTSR
jgi:cytochrome c